MSGIESLLFNGAFIERYSSFLRNTLKQPLDSYFGNFIKKIKSPEVPELVRNQITETINRNNLMSHILRSKEFLGILDEEKSLKGEDMKVGVVICIDGRISILHQFGKALNVKEIAGSLIHLNPRKTEIIDRRFISVLEQSADDGRELLEIVTAHTSLRHKDHRCGRIAMGLGREFVGEPDQVAIKEAERRTQLIEKKYNQILKAKGRPPQQQVAVTAMIDTDTMGLILNFGKEQLSTTELTRNLISKISQITDVGDFGSMKDSFTDPKSFIDYSKRVLKITSYLMKEEIGEDQSVTKDISNYINENYPDLTPKQQKALLFTICRTIASQYVTGLASEEEFAHPYADHEENYMSVATSKPFGRTDTIQSFGSAPATREEMLFHVKTKISLLEKHHKEKPYILFITTPIDNKILIKRNATLVGAEDAAKVYFQELCRDSFIRSKIKDGSLVIVPMLVDEESGNVLQIRDYSIYLEDSDENSN